MLKRRVRGTEGHSDPAFLSPLPEATEPTDHIKVDLNAVLVERAKFTTLRVRNNVIRAKLNKTED